MILPIVNMSDAVLSKLEIRAKELFVICDKEEKGFVTKRDMQRLRNDLPLDPDQLELVFDSLDVDKNGYLTLEEFTQGFGSYMDVEEEADVHCRQPENSADCQEMARSYDPLEENCQQDDDDNFMKLLDDLGGQSVFEDEECVKMLWDHFRQEDPTAVIQFEKFLGKVSRSFYSKQEEQLNMEEFMKSQNETREEQLRRLYEEMETQMKQEREDILQQEKAKEQQLKSELMEELNKKDLQLQKLIHKEKQMEEALRHLQTSDSAAKHQLNLLNKEKELLERQLELQQNRVEELKSAMEQLRKDCIQERRQRAVAAFNVTESIALEREGLVKQLDLLRSINTRLTDESDLREFGAGETCVSSMEDTSLKAELELCFKDNEAEEEEETFESTARVQVVSEVGCPSLFDELSSVLNSEEWVTSPLITMADGGRVPVSQDPLQTLVPDSIHKVEKTVDMSNNIQVNETMQKAQEITEEDFSPGTMSVQPWKTVLEKGINDVTWIVQSLSVPDDEISHVSTLSLTKEDHFHTFQDELTVGYYSNWEDRNHRLRLSEREKVKPSGFFKIIVVGDSGVGKTALIHRYCKDEYVPHSSATVGIDFQIRCVMVDNRQICLQFWDTAGQEKFRSITNQYYRKADGVIVMYDVNCERSFCSVRHWVEDIKGQADENIALLLIGNKIDIPLQQYTEQGKQLMSPIPPQVPTQTGKHLASKCSALFFETSAKTGYGIDEAMNAMAVELYQRQENYLENIALRLEHTDHPKKKCC